MEAEGSFTPVTVLLDVDEDGECRQFALLISGFSFYVMRKV
jgi:hypothetical protein